MRTGLHEAVATDDGDDRYDLDWLDDLPEDPRSSVKKLRELLERESDAISRHFMFSRLESDLYRLRDEEGEALARYDDACRAHDVEMQTIRPVLLEKFGSIPLLETYRQQSIRQQKVRNWNDGLWWAERGLSSYGEDAYKQDWVDDLRKRASHFRAKIETGAAPEVPTKRAKVPTNVAAMESLTCTRCGRTWQRTRSRGRKPVLCDTCRAQD